MRKIVHSRFQSGLLRVCLLALASACGYDAAQVTTDDSSSDDSALHKHRQPPPAAIADAGTPPTPSACAAVGTDVTAVLSGLTFTPSGTTLTGTVQVSGTITGCNAPLADWQPFTVKVLGTGVDTVVYSQPVANGTPSIAFSFALDSTQLANGWYTLNFTVGQSVPGRNVGSGIGISVNVQNAPSPCAVFGNQPMALLRDLTPTASMLTGTVHFTGTMLACNAPFASTQPFTVKLLATGVSATVYSAPVTAGATTFPFAFDLDTTAFANGFYSLNFMIQQQTSTSIVGTGISDVVSIAN